ncbi:MAG: hypothetical protein GF311_25110 [Candidatus Lokiarchaeota archaeon]|nr:hypothetical protein [Candidatus Lokiarchaeota archaeon]
MRYYCNICKRDITKAEFLYSVKHFDRPLCRDHQELERRNQEEITKIEKVKTQIENESSELEFKNNFQSEEEIKEADSERDWKSTGKIIAKKLGRTILKGAKKAVRYSKKVVQTRKWKGKILSRMTKNQLKKLCFENKISPTKEITKDGEEFGEFYIEEKDLTKSELVSKLKNRLKLGTIISFAERSNISIKDVLQEIEKKRIERELKEMEDKLKRDGNNLLLKLTKEIIKFQPPREYKKELYYQDTLASVLRIKFPNTAIEITRGSTRPDIVVNGVAIEIKGPTYHRDLKTIADKCLRYTQNFPQGLICVLFNVNITNQLYKEWCRGMKKNFPDVLILRK